MNRRIVFLKNGSCFSYAQRNNQHGCRKGLESHLVKKRLVNFLILTQPNLLNANRKAPHSPLSAHQIRLLHIQPPSTSSLSTIHCTLQNATFADGPLNKEPDYEALSYFWGSPTHPKFIQLDGKPCAIGENLWGALDALRYADRVRIL